jgi:plasmid stabilization system protein ParE
MTYSVRFTRGAEQDLLRLYDFLLEKDNSAARNALEAISKGIEFLGLFPFSCRKAEGGTANPFLRELLIPFGNTGYVALFEIEDAKTVTILAVRHQREDDYH